MEAQKWQSNTSLKERLLKEFYRFSFFKAVNLLESLFPDKKPLGQTLVPFEEVVRFSSKPGFVFPPSDISGIEQVDEFKPIDMEVAFMGLVGPSGVLPRWYNEQVLERLHDGDSGLKSFYDIFNHRLISLFYLGWKKPRLSVNFQPEAKDRISSRFLDLVGLGTPGLIENIGLQDNSLIYYYSGLLSRQVPSAISIESTVEYFTGTATNITQFVERMISISLEDQTQIGAENCELGSNTVCGSYIWESQTKFRVNLGPMGFDDFSRFIPTDKMLRSTFSLVRYMVGIEFEFEISLALKREEVPSCVLGGESALLGWSTWIKSPNIIHKDNPTVIFEETDL